MTKTTLIFLIIVLTSIFVIYFVYLLKKQNQTKLSTTMTLKLMLTGVIAFIADAFGIGSFAVTTAFSNMFHLVSVAELPAVLNTAQVIPGTIESLFFLKIVDIDLTVLTTLVSGACIGGVFGGYFVSKLNTRVLQAVMIAGFSFVLILLMGHGIHLFPMIGQEFEFNSWRLFLGFIGMLICGSLTSVGIGLFVSVQTVLYLLNITPILAFPIMTAAGAMQQPLTALTFLSAGKTPLKKVLILSVSGIVAVCFTLPFFTQIKVSWLHYLLMLVLTYNIIQLSADFFKTKFKRFDQLLGAAE